VQAEKTASENSAAEIGAEFALDEAGHGRTIAPGSGEEGLEPLAGDFVKERLLGLVAFDRRPAENDASSPRRTGTGKRIPRPSITAVSSRPRRRLKISNEIA
jgi:hypothetical protein